MNEGRVVFAQLLDFFPRYEFNKCVDRYRGNHRVRRFSCFDQFLSMAFAQLTHRDSLRDIEICLDAMDTKLYRAGFRSRVARSTLADANETRDWRIWADFAQVLIRTARDLYAGDDFGLELEQTVYALDSSTIDLCLSLFPWAKFRKHKGGIKIHTLLDLRGSIPSVVFITDAKVHDVNILDQLLFEPGRSTSTRSSEPGTAQSPPTRQRWKPRNTTPMPTESTASPRITICLNLLMILHSRFGIGACTTWPATPIIVGPECSPFFTACSRPRAVDGSWPKRRHRDTAAVAA